MYGEHESNLQGKTRKLQENYASVNKILREASYGIKVDSNQVSSMLCSSQHTHSSFLFTLVLSLELILLEQIGIITWKRD